MGRMWGLKICHLEATRYNKWHFQNPIYNKIAFSRPSDTKNTFSRSPDIRMTFLRPPVTKNGHFWDPQIEQNGFSRPPVPPIPKNAFSRPPHTRYFSTLTPIVQKWPNLVKNTQIWLKNIDPHTNIAKIWNPSPSRRNGQNLTPLSNNHKNLTPLQKITPDTKQNRDSWYKKWHFWDHHIQKMVFSRSPLTNNAFLRPPDTTKWHFRNPQIQKKYI